jgi:CheY-like chemotaxis protein
MHRILVIDDSKDIRDLIQRILMDAGYSVSVAGDGHEGLQLLRATHAEVVITDIFMPNQDGIETIAQLKAEFPGTKIIAISGGSKLVNSDSYSTTLREFGAHALLAKPFDPDELLRIVGTAVGKR